MTEDNIITEDDPRFECLEGASNGYPEVGGSESMKIKTKQELEESLDRCESYVAEIEELSRAIGIVYPSDKPSLWKQINIRLLKIISTEYSVKKRN